MAFKSCDVPDYFSLSFDTITSFDVFTSRNLAHFQSNVLKERLGSRDAKMTATSTNDAGNDVEEVCEDGRCLDGGIQTTELSYCVRCDSTYCRYEMSKCGEEFEC